MIDDVINSIPNMPMRQSYRGGNNDYLSSLLLPLIKQLLVEQKADRESNSKEFNSAVKAIQELLDNLTTLLQANDKSLITKDIEDLVRSLDYKLSNPSINVETNQDKVVSAIQGIKFPDKESVKVSNLSELTTLLKTLNSKIDDLDETCSEIDLALPSKLTIDNLKDISLAFPKEALDLLKLLKNLDTTAKRPLSVRLSDGQNYYKAIAGAVKSAVQGVAINSGNETPASKIVSGAKTMTGSAVQLTTTSTSCRWVEVSAIKYPAAIGGSNVVCDLGTPTNSIGTIIYPSQNPLKLRVNDPSLLYADATSGGVVTYNTYV